MIMDLWGSLKETQLDSEVGIKIFKEAAKEAGATVLFTESHHFGEGQGYTAIIGLAESHISIHTWPEEDFIAIDIFMCGNSDIIKARDYILKEFGGDGFLDVFERGRKRHEQGVHK